MDSKPNKPQPQKPASAPTANHRKSDNDYPWTQLLVLAFLTFNSVTAIYRSQNEPWTVAFVVVSYFDLILLFWCLKKIEKTSENPSSRGKLKVAIWLLSTILTVMFTYRVASIMPLAVKIVVWAMSGLSISVGFYAFFVYRENSVTVTGEMRSTEPV